MTRTSRTATNGTVTLEREDLGGAGGEPLLLVMGLGVSRYWWPDGPVHALIGAGFHVAAFDGRDAGASTHFDDVPARNPLTALLGPNRAACTAEDMTDDAVAVLDSLGWESALLFGHSHGGLVAQRIALRHPRRVRTLTSCAAVPSDARGAAVLRYVPLPFLARLAHLRFPRRPRGRRGGRPGRRAGGRLARVPLRRAGRPPSGATRARRRTCQRGPRHARPGTSDECARYMELPGTGHDLPSAVWPTVVQEVRALAEAAARH